VRGSHDRKNSPTKSEDISKNGVPLAYQGEPAGDAELRGVYGPTPEAYLEGGQRDVQSMMAILEHSGSPIETAGRVLDFGCSSGRMIRWLRGISNETEIWGTDIRSSRIIWCQQHLSPPFHFALTTLTPHLPFEDRYFGFVYAGSVFTHIDDLAFTWFMELRRILRPGGRLYITIHDHHTIGILAKKQRGDLGALIGVESVPEYDEYRNSDFAMFTIGRSLDAQVFFDVDFLRDWLKPFYHVLSVNKEAYAYQTAVLLERV
jgi:SAM-dependent methyltransferase